MAHSTLTHVSTAGVEQDADWQALLDRLPDDLDTSAFQHCALFRKRGIPNAATLLRLICAYACNLSLQAVATWAAVRGLARLSDQALDERIRQAVGWLEALLTQVLAARARLTTGLRIRVRLTDTTSVRRPGVQGQDWRVHLTADLQRLRLDASVLTDQTQGESLAHAAPVPGDLVVADRGLGQRAGLWALVQTGAWALVRLAWNNLPLQHGSGATFDLFGKALRTLEHGETGEWPVQTAPTPAVPAIAGRLVVARLSPEQTAAAQERVRKQYRNSSKYKGREPAPETLEAAGYVILFTTVPATLVGLADVLALYRFRWQIELLIKRYKSLLGLAEITARHAALCRAVLLAKLLLVVLADDLGADAEAFFP